jgi:micrococcal nuclease
MPTSFPQRSRRGWRLTVAAAGVLVGAGLVASGLTPSTNGPGPTGSTPIAQRRPPLPDGDGSPRVIDTFNRVPQPSIPAPRNGPSAASDLSGVPRVVDGDTIVVQGTPVRLDGLDAEELGEPHGRAAMAAMQEIVGVAAPVRCRPSGSSSYRRIVGICFNARGQDIAAELVRRGLALDCARYSRGRYRALEPSGARDRLIQKPYCVT